MQSWTTSAVASDACKFDRKRWRYHCDLRTSGRQTCRQTPLGMGVEEDEAAAEEGRHTDVELHSRQPSPGGPLRFGSLLPRSGGIDQVQGRTGADRPQSSSGRAQNRGRMGRIWGVGTNLQCFLCWTLLACNYRRARRTVLP